MSKSQAVSNALVDTATGEVISDGIVSARLGHGKDFAAYFDDTESLTRQEFAVECDVNEIMKQYEKTGFLPPSNRVPQYLDLTGVPDYQSAMNLMLSAREAFMTLPASVRKEFNNDPQEFVAFASDPENLEQMREWRLAPPAPEPAEPVVVRLAEPIAPAADAPVAAGPAAPKA